MQDQAEKKTVAIVGASTDRAKYGNKSLRAHQRAGWDVYPVNPKGGTIEGRKVYRTLADVPVQLDRVSFYLPPDVGLRVLPDVKLASPTEFFLNPGAESDELVAAAQELGIEPILACSIVDVGMRPDDFK